MSSTSVMSTGSLHDFSSDGSHHRSPHRKHVKSPGSRPGFISAEVQEEIDAMLEDVPVLQEHFSILDKIGSGTFSSVYVAKLRQHPQVSEKFALKHILPTSHPDRIENELRCLQEIGGCENVMGVKACLRHRDHVVIVMPYFPHDPFQDYVLTFSPEDVRAYMYNLLVALQRVHAVDLIHRDVKPSNFLFNRKLNKYALVDFGLAQKAPIPLRNSSSGSDTEPSTSKKSNNSPRDLRKSASSPDSEKYGITPGNTQLKKRKFESEERENDPESPRKKRGVDGGQSRKLAEVDMNTVHDLRDSSKSDLKSQIKDVRVVVKDTPIDQENLKIPQTLDTFPLSNKARSPRRQVLTKNIHLAHQGTRLFGASRKTIVLGSGSKAVYKSVAPSACQCFGQPQICSICNSRSNQVAPRAGTPGFRAPEVLMKYPDQSTAVDMWSAGVIFLSILSGRYPFFKANDDMTALAQIISIFGNEEMKAAARTYGKELICNPTMPACDLQLLCQKLRSAPSSRSKGRGDWDVLHESAYDLLAKLLELNPRKRIAAEEALKHSFFKQ